MKPDKYKQRFRSPMADNRVRRQIAREAARRLLASASSSEVKPPAIEPTESEFYAAKRKAAAVLGHPVRPGDLPSDDEVRALMIELDQAGGTEDSRDDETDDTPESPARMADHLDRFSVYKMRLAPLAEVKQNPKWHPEGDALYHSLQVFELARQHRPYDEEFLTAALLHDVGKAIEPHDHVATGLESLRGTLTPRASWLIEHHMDLCVRPDRPLNPKTKAQIEASEHYEDLVLLREVDEAGRVPGMEVRSVEEALDYLRGLEREDYLSE